MYKEKVHYFVERALILNMIAFCNHGDNECKTLRYLGFFYLHILNSLKEKREPLVFSTLSFFENKRLKKTIQVMHLQCYKELKT